MVDDERVFLPVIEYWEPQIGQRVRTATNGECQVNWHSDMANHDKTGVIINIDNVAPFGHRFQVWFDDPTNGVWLASGFAANELAPVDDRAQADCALTTGG